jgi:hypothetical protein
VADHIFPLFEKSPPKGFSAGIAAVWQVAQENTEPLGTRSGQLLFPIAGPCENSSPIERTALQIVTPTRFIVIVALLFLPKSRSAGEAIKPENSCQV